MSRVDVLSFLDHFSCKFRRLGNHFDSGCLNGLISSFCAVVFFFNIEKGYYFRRDFEDRAIIKLKKLVAVHLSFSLARFTRELEYTDLEYQKRSFPRKRLIAIYLSFTNPR